MMETQVCRGGYSVSVNERHHRLRRDGEGVVRMARDTPYKFHLTNSHDNVCVANIEIDGVEVGNFLLQKYSKCTIERPADRPLNFLFSPPMSTLHMDTTGSNAAVRRSNAKVPASSKRTNVLCTFIPEVGAQTIEFDVRAHDMNLCQRIEMPNDCSAHALFTELMEDYGQWVLARNCGLLHWTTAEYDSPVDDALTADMNTELRICKRKDEPIRKMSLVKANRLTLCVSFQFAPESWGTDDCMNTQSNICLEKSVELEEMATFGTVLDILTSPEICLDQQFTSVDDVWYFLSSTGRYLGSTHWLQTETCVYSVLHKDEILAEPSHLRLQVSRMRPSCCRSVFARVMGGNCCELEASQNTTIRELRLQLASRGGPWGEDPCWLFGGKLLESGRTLEYYGIGNRETLDIVLRLNSQGERPLTEHNPIVIESDKEVDTGCLIRKEEPAATSNSRGTKNNKKLQDRGQPNSGRMHRGGTVLKGRSLQQFIEVGPIDVDPRFRASILISLLPEGESESESEDETEPERHAAKNSCTLS